MATIRSSVGTDPAYAQAVEIEIDDMHTKTKIIVSQAQQQVLRNELNEILNQYGLIE